MTAGSGPTSPLPFAHFDHDSSSWRTSAPSLFEDSAPSPIRWPRSGTTSRGRAYELPTWGGHTAASGGSALLGTPMTTSGCGPGDLSSKRNRTRLGTQVVLLPTPRASENENRQTKRTPSQEAGTHGKNLASEACSLLPTPRATDHQDSMTAPGSRRHVEVRNGTLAETLGYNLLPTPRATDGTKGGPNQRGSSGDLTLPSAAVRLLPTPRASDTGTPGRRASEGFRPPLSQVILESTGEPTDPPSPDGSE